MHGSGQDAAGTTTHGSILMIICCCCALHPAAGCCWCWAVAALHAAGSKDTLLRILPFLLRDGRRYGRRKLQADSKVLLQPPGLLLLRPIPTYFST